MRNCKLLLSMVIVLFVVSILLFSSGCGTSDSDQGIFSPGSNKKSWTFLVYMAADNNLEAAGLLNIDMMEQIGSTNDVNIVVQYDRNGQYDPTLDWTGCRRYYITKDDTTGVIGSELIEDLGNVDTGDVNNLVSFVEWGMTKYPAEKYAVILWDHGSGWKHKGQTLAKGICWDDTSGNHITENQLRDGLARIAAYDGKKIELVGMDGCQMAHIEVMYDCMNSANYVVFSQHNVPFNGFPYHTILADLIASPSMSGATLGTSIVNRYVEYYTAQGENDVCMSCIDSANVPALVTALNNFSNEAIAQMTNEKANFLQAITNTATVESSSPDTKDIREYMNQLKALTNNATLQALATEVQNAFDATIVANQRGSAAQVQTANGMCIWLPDSTQFTASITDYDNLAWAAEKWDEFLKLVYAIGN